jgi:DedD protein
MDEQLKQRLLGATIIVILVVIFVPMLLEDPKHPASVAEVPAVPEAIEERTIALPQSPADVAHAEKEAKKEEAAAPKSGYQVIPLDDPPPKPAKPEPAAEAAAPADEASEEAGEFVDEEQFAGEGDEPPSGQPAAPPPVPKAPEPVRQGKAASSAPSAAPTAKLVPVPGKPKPNAEAPAQGGRAAAEKPEPAATKPAAKPKAAASAPKPADTVAKKPAKPKPAQPKPTEPAAAKPVPAQQESADAGEPPPAKPPQPKPAAKAPPPSPRPAAKPAEAGTPTAWMVQAGSFAGEANARALADRLRKQNIAAFVETVAGSSGTTTYRVRVGPAPDRSRAEQVQRQIESAVGIKGYIVPRR